MEKEAEAGNEDGEERPVWGLCAVGSWKLLHVFEQRDRHPRGTADSPLTCGDLTTRPVSSVTECLEVFPKRER